MRPFYIRSDEVIKSLILILEILIFFPLFKNYFPIFNLSSLNTKKSSIFILDFLSII